MKKFLLYSASLLLFGSCAVHQGTITSTDVKPGARYVDVAIGITHSKKIFGFGGLKQDALVLDAKREMQKNRPLKLNEVYANYTIDFKESYWPFVEQTKVTVCADVLVFTNDTLCDPYSENYKQKIFSKNLQVELFNVGDSIIYDKSKNGVIISFMKGDKARVRVETKTGSFSTKTLSVYKLFTKHKVHKGYRMGDVYTTTIVNNDKVSYKTGRVSAVGLNGLLIIPSGESAVRYEEYEN
jgi:hypothetical protein